MERRPHRYHVGNLYVVLDATQPTCKHKHNFVRTKSGFNSVSNPHMLELFDQSQNVAPLAGVF